MHLWGDEDVDWDGINAAARYIGYWLRKWGRLPVRDFKEKYGTVRIYCGFGWHSFQDIFYPGYVYYRLPKWFRDIDWFVFYTCRFIVLINYVILPIHRKLYRWRYLSAIKKWPHLRKEILVCADWPEELRGL